MLDRMRVAVIPAPGTNVIDPETSQSPAVKLSDAQFAATSVVSDTGVVLFTDRYSPTLPAAALPAFVTPVIVGVVMVGDVPNTAAPVPVSSVRTPANCADVVLENCARDAPD